MIDQTPLAGKTAFVTGAGRGVGRSIALHLARAGANLAICARSADELKTLQTDVESLGRRCLVGVVDLTQPAATQYFCTTALSEFGIIDIVINNAGADLDVGQFSESDPDLWWKTVEVNVRGPYLVTRFLLDGISEGGKIINVSSGMGRRAGDRNSAYHVSKAALNMLSDALANELWQRKIDVNTLIPGPVATSMFNRDQPGEGRTPPEEVMARFADDLPPGFPTWERLKHPDEVGALALHMATQPVGGPNGQTFSLARRPL